MGLANKERLLMLFFMFMMVFSGFSSGSVYKIGDSADWSIIGNVDYAKWSSSKTFQVGDILIFHYDLPYHNVLEVSRSDFHSCNVAAPFATYTTGNDSVVLRSPGHYYYICGFVGHCQAGQKVDIRVPRSGKPVTGPIQSPVEAPRELAVPVVSPDGPVAPSPSANSGQSLVCCIRLFCLESIGLLMIVIWVLN